MMYFNSHAHVERDCALNVRVGFLTDFNSHAHVERDHRYARCCLILVDFNSHAHVERDCCLAVAFRKADISTHTLTWSVTKTEIHIANEINISTHTLTWSVT